MSTVREALSGAVDALAAAGVDDPPLDASVLLADVCARERAELLAAPSMRLEPPAARRFAIAVRRRLRREPVAYITGRRGFRHLDLRADARALIPRPETEMLVELALERVPATLLDVGTGSGAIALAVADELSQCVVTACDTSAPALALAAENAEALGLAGRVELRAGSVPVDGSWECVLANLPYVSEAEWAGLSPEITAHEPRRALVAGSDGLDAIRDVVPAVALVQPAGATIGLEIGASQGSAVAEIVERAGYDRVEVRRDLAGLDRMVTGVRA